MGIGRPASHDLLLSHMPSQKYVICCIIGLLSNSLATAAWDPSSNPIIPATKVARYVDLPSVIAHTAHPHLLYHDVLPIKKSLS